MRRLPWRVALDVDGVLAEQLQPFRPQVIGPPLEGGVRLLEDLLGQGVRVTLLSSRPPELVEAWLERYQLPTVPVWRGAGKPDADAYVDDRAVPCRPADNPAAYDEARAALEQLLTVRRAGPRAARRPS